MSGTMPSMDQAPIVVYDHNPHEQQVEENSDKKLFTDDMPKT